METKISIITVAYNSANTIARTITSVLNQTSAPYEYIIVDGKSTDETVSIAESFRTEFETKGVGYQVISEPDKGIYDAMNKGIAMSQGELVGMINSDDWYEPEALETVIKEYEKQKFDLIYADLRVVRRNGSAIIKKAKFRKYVTSRDWNHPTTFMKRSIYENFNYDINNLLADWDLVVKVRKAGYKIVVVNRILANFTVDGVSHDRSIKEFIRRIKLKYGIYRANGYSRFYFFECVLIEGAKAILG